MSVKADIRIDLEAAKAHHPLEVTVRRRGCREGEAACRREQSAGACHFVALPAGCTGRTSFAVGCDSRWRAIE